MRTLIIPLALLAVSVTARGSATAEEPQLTSPIPESSRQLLLVRAAFWYSGTGTLERYERSANQSWKQVGSSIAVNLGRSGLGWGRGLHTFKESGPVKREGDGRSPAGAFLLGTAFGVAETLPAGAHAFPYLSTLPSTYCVEDVRSSHYNQIIDSKEVTPSAWERWSQMKRADGLFNWGIVVRQNEPDIKKNAGSCVFLHIWRGPREPTAGCTALPPESIEEVLKWLEGSAKPVLVQLPEPVFQNLRKAWMLP